ncbi:MAG: M20 family metallopeptidase [Micrococcaceae bacterium]|nr:M20 family metallopeptidase [Micrococcaceae bacterium]
MDRIKAESNRQSEKLVALRRILHQNPEIGLDLPDTQRVVLDVLSQFPDLEIQIGVQCSSVTAVLRGGAGTPGGSNPVVLLRADMDGLPVEEKTSLPFASRVKGAMHACGHDLHMAMLCGAVETLYSVREELSVDVVFMFQPGEEGYGGAKLMLDEGVLSAAGQPVDAAFGLHVFSAGMEPGVFYSRPQTLMAAADVVRVTLRGEGGHGSTPYRAKDPIPVACEMILALQTLVTREVNIFDPVVLTVGTLHAGAAPNVIPDSVEFGISLRTYSEDTRHRMLLRIRELTQGFAGAHGMHVEFDVDEGYPVTRNDPLEHEFALSSISKIFGESRVQTMKDPMPGSEDFSFVLNEVPGAFILLGTPAKGSNAADAPLNHSPLAEFDDSLLVDGVCVLATLAAAFPSRRKAYQP